MALVAAMVLNAIFRVGVRKRQSLSLAPGAEAYRAIRAFFDENGSRWGARRDVIERAAFACDQAFEVVTEYCEVRGPVTIEASFDEYSLDVSLAYDGAMLELPSERPSPEELLEDSGSVHRLGGYLIRRIADRVRATRRGDRSVVQFQFHH